jgi:hypothetical protein
MATQIDAAKLERYSRQMATRLGPLPVTSRVHSAAGRTFGCFRLARIEAPGAHWDSRLLLTADGGVSASEIETSANGGVS